MSLEDWKTSRLEIEIRKSEIEIMKKAARLGISLKGTKMYCTYFPCTGVILGPFSLFGPTIGNYEFVRFIK